ncbi:MAG: hypothetical protein ACRDXC_06915, partial [Acidimicrobiales bacterium]
MSLSIRPGRSGPSRLGTAALVRLLPTLAITMTGAFGAFGTGAFGAFGTGALGAFGAPEAAAARVVRSAAHSTAAIVLDDQTEWVMAPKTPAKGASVAPAHFDLELTARDAPAGAAVGVVVYPRLRSRYALEAAVRDGPRGTPLSSTVPVAYGGLSPEPRSAAAVTLDFSVVQSAASNQHSRIGLACAPPTGTGTCTGVYPVVVELLRPNGKVLHRLTTFLTYVSGKSAHPLELAWVVPVAAPVGLSANPSKPTAGIAPITATETSTLEDLVAELRASTIPVTLDPSPETLQRLESAGVRGRATDTMLAELSTNRTRVQVLSSPYVPFDLGALAGAGEPTEIVAQMAAGATVLHHLQVEPSASSPWVQRGRVGRDIVTGLGRVGTNQLVLPETDLAPTTGTTSAGTWVSSFSLDVPGRRTPAQVQAAESDTWLDAQFTSHRDDPALAATQLLADLAMVYFERPNTPATRGMVALPPAGWVANPVFTHVLVGGLSQDPLVAPVTLSHFFDSVGRGGKRELLSSGSGPVLEHSLARALSRARVRLSDFDGAVVGRPPVLSELDDMLLAS